MKLNFAPIVIAAVATFAINVGYAAPLPGTNMQDIKFAGMGPGGDNELDASVSLDWSRDLARLGDLDSVANQRLSGTLLAESSGNGVTTAYHPEIHRAFQTLPNSKITPLGKVIRTFQASPKKLKKLKNMDSKAWETVNHLWQEKRRNKKKTLRIPPPPGEGETAEEYALRLSEMLSLGL